ncbi:unnamed protein product [Rotaria sp. Silwood2]|nr:unnamed protein product [Rotaria sp. Silwood2]CAF2749248.1 unnamed protein product [Rotaria sp. Silwood2]CAF2991145.1 unnamed protein product [Rotaria sp. Silwood2]CAF3163672.1 unnamed protein product [Rotaria sp. Silwood2]CAF3907945.1 unnamed protein product [Rotaria sp. Silwood2]
MFDYYQSDPYVLSSVCPYSCGLVQFALRIGGTIDPDFLNQCQIMDPKFQNAIDGLKSIPLKFEAPSESYGYQEDIYLDMDARNAKDFYNAWDFKEYNSWLGTTDQWESMEDVDNDIVIDFM